MVVHDNKLFDNVNNLYYVNKIKGQLFSTPFCSYICITLYTSTRLYTDLKLKATLHDEAKYFYKRFHNNRPSPPSNSLIQNFVLFYETR